jgi:hypothetical protein
VRLGVKDDRIRRPLHLYATAYRVTVRLIWSLFLLSLSVPGLLLWIPVLLTTAYSVHNFKKTGPVWDTWDEIAQYKLIYGESLALLVKRVRSDDVLRVDVRYMCLGWGHVGHPTIRQHNFLCYTSADVDDAPVCWSADEGLWTDKCQT